MVVIGLSGPVSHAVTAFPNPNRRSFVPAVPGGLAEPAQVEVVNALGQLVYAATRTPGKHAIVLGDVPAGVYMLRVHTGLGYPVARVVVVE